MRGSRLRLSVTIMAFLLAAACDRQQDVADGDRSSGTTPMSSGRSGEEEGRDATLTIIPPGPERAAAGPKFLFFLRDNVFGALDAVDREIVFMDGGGLRLTAAALPANFDVRDIEIGRDVVLRGDESAVVLAREGPIAGQLAETRAPPATTSISRRNADLIVNYVRNGGRRSFIVSPQRQGSVLAATYIGEDARGQPHAYWEEGSGAEVTGWVGRFHENGRLAAGSPIDVSDVVDIPALPVAVDRAGRILLMKSMADSVQLVELTLPDGRAGPAEIDPVGTAPARVLNVGQSFRAIDDARYELEPLSRDPVPYDPDFAAQVLARARAYLTATWTLRQPNYEQTAIANSCDPPAGKYWTRPLHLTRSSIDRTVQGIPYRWGGFDTTDSFRRKLAANSPGLAGDICTCRQAAYRSCLVSIAAGVDCSGFVSRAWGLRSHTSTTAMGSVAVRLAGLGDLKPGDILNRPGNHVRLFVQFERGPQMRIRTLESAVSCGGVCERVYTPVQLARYRPMRLRRG